MQDPAEAIISFLRREVLIDPAMEIDLDTPLVSSGLVDSFALIEVLVQLERATGTKIPAGKVAPQDLNSVREMLETAARVGAPGK